MSGDSRVFPPLTTPSITLSSVPGGTFNPNVSTSFQANSAQTTPYNLIFPSALPSTTNQALLSDTSGNLTWGTVASSSGGGSSSGTSATNSAAFGTFAATAPQATPAPVTGLQFSNVFTSAQVYVAVSATTNIYAIYDIQAFQKGSTTTWSLTYSLTTDTDDNDPGLIFSITSTGQVQYTSPSFSGWTATNVQWYYSYNYTTTTSTSQITNTFSGANNITTPTPVTGLLVPTNSTQWMVTLFVAVKAATNLSALVSATVYRNAAGTAYQLQTTNTGDNVGITLSVNTSGQILYTSTTYSGFISLVFSWTTPFIGSTTATSLTSLALSSNLTVNGKTLLGQGAASGSVVSTIGSLVSIAGSTYTDTSTAASSTATGTFSGTYLGIPTLAATNTAVTNPLASTLTVAGAPVAGTNTIITNAYALNVLNGISQFAGPILANGPLTAKVVTGTSLVLGNSVVTGTLSSTLGQFLTIQPQTYTDTGTVASGTAAGTFSGTYLGIPTLTATNTGVTTGTASTLTIAGPPTAGTNETITNSYALNVVSGNSFFGGTITSTQQSYLKTAGTATSSNQSVPQGKTIIMPTIVGNSGITYSTSTGIATVLSAGLYDIRVMFSLNTAVISYLAVWINGTINPQRLVQNNTSLQSIIGSSIYMVPAGATIYITNDSAATITLNGNIADCVYSIHKVN